jgi:hypothetical protein
MISQRAPFVKKEMHAKFPTWVWSVQISLFSGQGSLASGNVINLRIASIRTSLITFSTPGVYLPPPYVVRGCGWAAKATLMQLKKGKD